jgi:hydroxymethylpyrimidine/phosphomethylpyrimidine kinase
MDLCPSSRFRSMFDSGIIEKASLPLMANSPQLSRTATPVALTIAGFDPSCGAGITADLKTFAAHRVYGMAAITALTVQSTQGVRLVEPVAPELLGETLRCLDEDTGFAGLKIGMLGTGAIVREVGAFLGGVATPRSRIVLDPVLCSSSGAALLDGEGLALVRSELLAQVGWITPNLDELQLLTGVHVERAEDVPPAAMRLRAMAAGSGNAELSVVVTGGHLARPDDFVLTADEAGEPKGSWVRGERIATNATHGTGCAFSSALLCELVAGASGVDAVRGAKDYVAGALRSAYPVGRGRGPMHHLFRLG